MSLPNLPTLDCNHDWDLWVIISLIGLAYFFT
jgi:hypothetical protein